MKRAITRVLAGLLMLTVAILAAFASMRLAIHGREIDVPSLAGLSDQEAAVATRKLGLDLSVENRFYSGAVAANHVLSQSPPAGALVRRGSQVRVTESLGGQQVSVPDLAGQTERPASLTLRRQQLEIGQTAYLPVPFPEGTILAQSPPPSSSGLSGPRVSLLVAAPESGAPAQAYVMPQLIGMTVSGANSSLSSVGLRIASAQYPQTESQPASPVSDATIMDSLTDPGVSPVAVQPPPPGPGAVIIGQSPAPGHRLSRGEAIRVTVAHAASQPQPAALPVVPF